MIKLYNRHITGDYDLEQIQDRVEDFEQTLFEHIPLLDGAYLEDIDIDVAPAVTRVPHTLDRNARGWFIAAIDADAAVYQTQDPDARYLYLTAGAACTASIWVF